jgi:hypothetical protein
MTGFLQASVGAGDRTGAGDLAQIHPLRRTARWNSETIRMAHLPALVLDSAAECGN